MPVDPADIEQITQDTVDLYRAAEQAILAQVTRRLAAGMGAPDWAVTRLGALSGLRRSVQRILDLVRGRLGESIQATLAAAYRLGTGAATAELPARLLPREPDTVTARAGAYGRVRTDVVESLAAALSRDVGVRSSNVLRHVDDVYRRVVAEATAAGVAGGLTRLQASQLAYQRFVDQGVASFTDVRGRTWRLSSYVEMATRTVSQRAAVQGQTDRLQAMGVDTVIVSDSPRECPKCRPWEGKVLSVSGRQRGRVELPSMVGSGTVTVDIAGTLDEARAAGLQHPNCTHSIRSYLPGATKLKAADHDPEGNKAQDRQRYIERQIRRFKEREAAALDPAAATAARAKKLAWQKEMRAHLAANPGLKRLPYREQIGAGNIPPGPIKLPPPARTAPPPAPRTGAAALASAPINVRSKAGLARLTSQQRDMISQYRSSLYANLNGALRRESGKLPGGWAFEVYHDAARALDSALRKSALTDDVILYRGIKDPVAVFGQSAGQPLAAGTRWTEHAYVSSTASRATADEFAEGGAILEIRVPAGTGALQLSGAEYESELLLARGLRLRIVSDTGPVSSGTRLIRAEVMR